MTTVIPGRRSTPASDTLNLARQTLAGKRLALVGFNDAGAEELAQMISEAHAFARRFPLETDASSDVLKPFELLLIHMDGADNSHWLNAEQSAAVINRSLAVGDAGVLMALVTHSQLPYREFSVWPVSADELLFRCILALRSGSSAAGRTTATNSMVVLADDDPSITTLVRLTLQRSGMSCEVASNGGEALELIDKLKPCATILDIGMPNMDGFQVLSRIRNNPDLAQTRVILLTGCEQEMDILRGFSLGADDYVTKPFNPMELLMRLKRAIGRL